MPQSLRGLGKTSYTMPAGLNPTQLGAIPIRYVYPLDGRWTIDQIAQRNAFEILYIVTGHY